MLAWSAALVADALIAQHNARSAFDTALLATRVAVPSALDEMRIVAPAPLLRAVERGSPIAALSIPRIHLSAMVLHGSDAQTLRRGPGHLENTAFPGELGNVVIAGHRDTFFWSLQNIHLGDDIFLDTSEGPSEYRVTSARVVNPNEVSILAPTDEPVLTLITCYPFSVLGPAPDRFVVRARRVDKPSAAPVEAPTEVLPEPARSASIDVIGANQSISPGRARDDHSLVQEAVGRYLRIQGARLVTRTDLRFGGSPAFICDITFSDDRAIADCNAVTPSSSDQKPNGRIFALERSDDSWAIRSVALK
jgi:LPXTG-site transpeptidase (sortase) family protein